MAAIARRPGVVASRRGAGGRGLRSPLPPTTPNPALGLPSLTDTTDTQGVPLASYLPRGSGRSASRCPAPTRDERPSGVGASAPAGRRSPPRPAALMSASGIAAPAPQAVCRPFDVGRERRLSFVDSVHCAGKTVLVMREMLPAGRSTNRDKPHQPSEPGRGGDPRAAGAPQQARISPAKREDARRLAPCGERRTR